MTLQELGQLYYLNNEINMDERRLADLENVDGTAEIKDIITKKRRRCIEQRDALEEYIASVNDAFVRQVLMLRCACALPWRDVAARAGGLNTSSSMRMLAKRFVDKN